MSEEIQPETGGQGEVPLAPPEPELQPEAGITQGEQGEAQPAPARMTREKWILMVGGFIGWFVVNGFILWQYYLTYVNVENIGETVYPFVGYFLCFPANVLVLIILALKPKSRPVAFGILAAWGINLMICILQGSLLMGLCGFPFFTSKF